jgi:hypothetical protein
MNMSKPQLTITNIDDETVSYSLNDVQIIYANHDDHGWSGMEDIKKAMYNVAKAIDAKVVEVDAEN